MISTIKRKIEKQGNPKEFNAKVIKFWIKFNLSFPNNYSLYYEPLSGLGKDVLEIVNSAINVCSNMIGCFAVVPLTPAPTVI